VHGSIGDAGGGILAHRLTQHLLGSYLGNLAEHQIAVGSIGGNKNVLQRDDVGKTVEGGAQQTLARVEHIKELLGTVLTTDGPKAATYATRHNHTKMVIVHSSGNVFGMKCVIFAQLPSVTIGQKYEKLLPLPIIMELILQRLYFLNDKI
jgi:hypothetical protein